MKTKEPELRFKPLKSYGYTFNNLFVLDTSDNNKLSYQVMHKNGGSATIIARTKPMDRAVISSIRNEEEQVEYAVADCFKDVRCAVCHKKFSAIRMGETELGPVCCFDLRTSKPKIPFAPLKSLEKMVKEDYKH